MGTSTEAEALLVVPNSELHVVRVFKHSCESACIAARQPDRTCQPLHPCCSPDLQVEDNAQRLLTTGPFMVSILGDPSHPEGQKIQAAVGSTTWLLGKHLPALKAADTIYSFGLEQSRTTYYCLVLPSGGWPGPQPPCLAGTPTPTLRPYLHCMHAVLLPYGLHPS
jgi:hypothetical protein